MHFLSNFRKLVLTSFFLILFFLVSSPKAFAVNSNGYWEEVGALSIERVLTLSALLNDGRVIAAGGTANGIIYKTTEIYNPITKIWSTTNDLNYPRWDASKPHSVVFSDGKVLVAGGEYNGNPINTSEIYNPINGAWSQVDSLNTSRVYGVLAPLPGDKALMATGGLGGGLRSTTAEIYDPNIDTWTYTGNLTIGRQLEDTSYALLHDGRILIAGGGSNFKFAEDTAEVYDPSSGIWAMTGPMPFEFNHGTITTLSDGRVLIAGSLRQVNPNFDVLDSAAIYDPATNQWSSVSPMPDPRNQHDAILLEDGNVLIFGGFDANLNYYSSTYIYNPNDDAWSFGPEMPKHYRLGSVTKLQNGDYLVAGGTEGFNGFGTYGNSYLFTNGETTFLNVPYFNQNVEPWGPQEYDHAISQNVTNPDFERWGCAVTSAAMILNYHEMTQFPDGTPINPATLNEWLESNDGYATRIDGFGKPYSVIIWKKIGTLTNLLYKAGKASYKLNPIPFSNPNNLEDDLELREIAGKNVGAPPIVRVTKGGPDNGHYVVPKGLSGGNVSINDPEWNYPDLTSFDNISYTDYHSYIPSLTNLSSLYFVINSNVEMLIADSDGNKTGEIIVNGNKNAYNDNSEAVYVFEGPISNPNNQNIVEQLGSGANIYSLNFPDEGEYKIQITSTENAFYTLNASTFQVDGTHALHKIEGIIGPNSVDEFTINYSKTSESEVEEIIDFNTLISDIKILYNLNEITNKKYYALLLAEAHLAKRLDQKWYSKKASKNLLKAMNRNIDRNTGRYLTQNAFEILDKDIGYLIQK